MDVCKLHEPFLSVFHLLFIELRVTIKKNGPIRWIISHALLKRLNKPVDESTVFPVSPQPRWHESLIIFFFYNDSTKECKYLLRCFLMKALSVKSKSEGNGFRTFNSNTCQNNLTKGFRNRMKLICKESFFRLWISEHNRRFFLNSSLIKPFSLILLCACYLPLKLYMSLWNISHSYVCSYGMSWIWFSFLT